MFVSAPKYATSELKDGGHRQGRDVTAVDAISQTTIYEVGFTKGKGAKSRLSIHQVARVASSFFLGTS